MVDYSLTPHLRQLEPLEDLCQDQPEISKSDLQRMLLDQGFIREQFQKRSWNNKNNN